MNFEIKERNVKWKSGLKKVNIDLSNETGFIHAEYSEKNKLVYLICESNNTGFTVLCYTTKGISVGRNTFNYKFIKVTPSYDGKVHILYLNEDKTYEGILANGEIESCIPVLPYGYEEQEETAEKDLNENT